MSHLLNGIYSPVLDGSNMQEEDVRHFFCCAFHDFAVRCVSTRSALK